MPHFPSITPAGAFESPAVQNEIKALAEQVITTNRYGTGWRDVSAWVPNVVSGRMLLKRTGVEMIVALDELTLSVGGQISIARFPVSLRPLFRVRGNWFPSTGTGASGSLNISNSGYCNLYDVVAGQAMTARITGDFAEGQAWPSPVPGTPI